MNTGFNLQFSAMFVPIFLNVVKGEKFYFTFFTTYTFTTIGRYGFDFQSKITGPFSGIPPSLVGFNRHVLFHPSILTRLLFRCKFIEPVLGRICIFFQTDGTSHTVRFGCSMNLRGRMKNLFGDDNEFDKFFTRVSQILDPEPVERKLRIRLTDAQIGLMLTGTTLTVKLGDLTVTLEKKQ
jgi:hypothetical protein